VRAAAASANRVHLAKADVIEQLRRVVRDDGDAATVQAGRLAVAGPVEDQHADAETYVGVLARMPGLSRSGRPLEAQHGRAVLRAVLTPGEESTVAQLERGFARRRDLDVLVLPNLGAHPE
jgi:hypothetical protein